MRALVTPVRTMVCVQAIWVATVVGVQMDLKAKTARVGVSRAILIILFWVALLDQWRQELNYFEWGMPCRMSLQGTVEKVQKNNQHKTRAQT